MKSFIDTIDHLKQNTFIKTFRQLQRSINGKHSPEAIIRFAVSQGSLKASEKRRFQ